jgi:hypothetical protein
MSQVRVKLPTHQRRLANVDSEVMLDVAGPVTLGAVLDALESRHPVLRGTFATTRHANAGRSCGSSPASRICPTSRPTRHCPS